MTFNLPRGYPLPNMPKNCILCNDSRDVKILFQFGTAPITNSEAFKLLLESGTAPLIRVLCCKKCNLVYADENLKSDDLKGIYNSLGDTCDLFPAEEKTSLEEGMARTRDKIGIITKYIKDGDGKVLDVGCARGHLLMLLNNRMKGFNYYGVDVSRITVERGRKEFGFNLFAGTLEEANYPSSFFKWVTAFDVLEHMQNPLATLKEINRISEQGGGLILEVPNENTLFRWVAKILFLVTRGRLYWPLEQLYEPLHLFYFSRKSMRRSLSQAGFTIIEMTTKESYRTRYGLSDMNLLKRMVIRSLAFVDSILCTGAKLVVCARKVS